MHDNIAKKRSKSLVIPTGKSTDHMAYKFLNQAHAWFLKVDPVRIVSMCVYVCVCVCMCVCVSTPRLLITSGVMWRDIDPI